MCVRKCVKRGISGCARGCLRGCTVLEGVSAGVLLEGVSESYMNSCEISW